MIKGKSHFDVELFHDDFNVAVGEAPIFIVEPLKRPPSKRQIRGRELLYFRQSMIKKFWHLTVMHVAFRRALEQA